MEMLWKYSIQYVFRDIIMDYYEVMLAPDLFNEVMEDI